MLKSNLKELIIIIALSLINIFSAFFITNLFGITNVVVLKSYSVVYNYMTFEVIIFMVLLLFEALIYDYYLKTQKDLPYNK